MWTVGVLARKYFGRTAEALREDFAVLRRRAQGRASVAGGPAGEPRPAGSGPPPAEAPEDEIARLRRRLAELEDDATGSKPTSEAPEPGRRPGLSADEPSTAPERPRTWVAALGRVAVDHPLILLALAPAPVILLEVAGAAVFGCVLSGAAALVVFGAQMAHSADEIARRERPGDAVRLGPLLDELRARRGALVGAVALRTGSVLLGLVPFVTIGLSLDLVGGGAALGLVGLTAIGVAAVGAHVVLHHRSTMQIEAIAQATVHALRMRIYRHTLDLPLPYFEDASQAALLSGLGDDLASVERIFAAFRRSLQTAATVTAVSAGLLVWAPQLGWPVLWALPTLVALAERVQRSFFPLFRAWMAQGARLSGVVAGSLEGIATVKSTPAEGRLAERVEAESEAYRRMGMDAARLWTRIIPIVDGTVLGAMVISVGAGALGLAGGVGAGRFAATALLTQQLLVPLSDIGPISVELNRGLAGYARATAPLAVAPEPRGGARIDGAARGAVAFEHVRFGYPGRPLLFEDLSLRVAPGRTTAIVGDTGAGKSTIAKLLLRCYDVGGGRVTIGGLDVQGLDRSSLRRAVGVVSQDIFLFDGSILDNLRVGYEDRPVEAAIEAARQAGAHEFIEALPEGYATRVGERGVKLSGGQRQRIAIARALLKDAPVVVLDEATAHVDQRTEAALLSSLSQVLSGRTVIVIAHRLSAVRMADTICVLKGGRVAEQGSHEALLVRGGDYAALFRLRGSLSS
jgi:ATP-binding cassette subfamily B protein